MILLWRVAYFGSFQVDKHMVIVVNGMSICGGFAAASLKVFAADKTTIHVDVGRRHRAHLLEVEI